MKRKLSPAGFFMGILLLCLTNSYSQWQQIGPYGGNVNHIALLSDNSLHQKLYSWTGSGLISAEEFGTDWQYEFRTFPENTTVIPRTDEVSDSILYAYSIWDILQSTNFGGTWDNLNLPFTISYSNEILSLAAYVNNSNITYLFAGSTSGVYLTINNGNSWTKVNNGLLPGYGNDTSITSLSIYSKTNDTTYIFAGTQGNGVFMTNNNGDYWEQLNGFPVNDPYVSALATGQNLNGGLNIYAGTAAGIFRSSNYGLSWTQIITGLTDLWVKDIVDDSNNILAGTRYGGFYLSTNFGSSWSTSNNGFSNIWIHTICSNQEYLYAGTEHYGSFRSSDSGVHWDNINSSIFYTMHTKNSNGDSILAGTDNSSIMISTNYGTNWSSVILDSSYNSIRNLEIDGPKIYASSEEGLYFSTNNGINWLRISPWSYPITIKTFTTRLIQVSEIEIIVGTFYESSYQYSSIYKSTDNGITWIERSNANGIPSVIKANDIYVYLGTFGYGIYRSSDDGINWESINSGLSNLEIHSLAIFNDYVFAGTENGIFISNDTGTTWSELNIGLPPNTSISSIEINSQNDIIYLGTSSNGIWKARLSEITSIKADHKPAVNFMLAQNYPNPFNPTTNIEYQIPNREFVTLKVYDVLGNEVATLVNEEKPGGSYTIKFDGSKLSSGVYFYRLQAGEYSSTKKLILMK